MCLGNALLGGELASGKTINPIYGMSDYNNLATNTELLPNVIKLINSFIVNICGDFVVLAGNFKKWTWNRF